MPQALRPGTMAQVSTREGVVWEGSRARTLRVRHPCGGGDTGSTGGPEMGSQGSGLARAECFSSPGRAGPAPCPSPDSPWSICCQGLLPLPPRAAGTAGEAWGLRWGASRGQRMREWGWGGPSSGPSVGPPPLPLGCIPTVHPLTQTLPSRGPRTLGSHSLSRGAPAGGICQGNVPKWSSHPPASPPPRPGRRKGCKYTRLLSRSSGWKRWGCLSCWVHSRGLETGRTSGLR